VGRIDQQKGHFLLLEAIARLRPENRDLKVVCAGDGPSRLQFDRQIKTLGLQRQIRITGWLTNDEVYNELRSSRALLLPSFAEGVPVVAMEALACERPVITTFVGGIPELVTHMETGWMIPAGSADALALAIDACIEAPDEQVIRMGQDGRRHVLELHDISREAAKLINLFHTVREPKPSLDAAAQERNVYVSELNQNSLAPLRPDP
jgi:glycosyltransferase involved in cell wall biosynthesis